MRKRSHERHGPRRPVRKEDRPRFLMDNGLGRLAGALVHMDYDASAVRENLRDDLVHLATARREHRVFVTRDEARLRKHLDDLYDRPGILCISIPKASFEDLLWAVSQSLRFLRTARSYFGKGILITRTQIKVYRSRADSTVIAVRKDLIEKGTT